MSFLVLGLARYEPPTLRGKKVFEESAYERGRRYETLLTYISYPCGFFLSLSHVFILWMSFYTQDLFFEKTGQFSIGRNLVNESSILWLRLNPTHRDMTSLSRCM